MNKLAITLTCASRPEYLTEVIDSLKNTDKTDLDIVLFPSIDYKNEEVVDIIKSINFIETNISVNNPPLGCNLNTLQAIKRGIDSNFSEFLIHIEDDTVLSKDALQFFIYCFTRYKDDSNIISVGGYNKTNKILTDQIYSVFVQNFFAVWGCGFWSNKWELIKNNWSTNFDTHNRGKSWDSHLNDTLFVRDKYSQVRPQISRMQNIGAKNGSWVTDPVWHYYNHRTPVTSDNYTESINWIDYAKNNQ